MVKTPPSVTPIVERERANVMKLGSEGWIEKTYDYIASNSDVD